MILKILAVQLVFTALLCAAILGQWFAHDLPANIAVLCALVLMTCLASLHKILWGILP